MADNVTLNSGSGGAVVATDDIGGVHYQIAKLAFGALDTANVVTSTTTNPFPVALSDTDNAVLDAIAASVAGTLTVGSHAVTNAGTFAVQVDGAALTALQLLDDVVYVDDADWTALTSKHALVGGLYQSSPGTVTDGDVGPFRMDSNGRIIVSPGTALDVSAATVTVDGSGVTQPVSGTVTANLGATDNAVLDQIDANTDFGAVTGGGVEASALRVTIASDSTGVISVDDGGGALTVDGTVGISGTVTVDLGANNDVTIDGSSIVATEDGSSGGAAVGVPAMAVRDDSLATLTPVEGDYVPLRVGSTGALHVVETNSTAILADTANMDTNLGTLAGAVAGSEMQVDVVGALPAGTNAIGKLAANSGVDIGDVDVTSIAAGANLIGDVGISGARTSGGTTLYKNLDVDESEDQVKGTAGQVYWIVAFNLASSKRYLKLYNATAASVTVGTTTPDLTFPIPTTGDTNGAGFVLSIPNGIAFSTAITIAATTAIGDSDTGAPGANEVVVMLGYA